MLRLHVYPRLGAKPCTAVTRGDVRTLIAELIAQGKSRDLVR